MFAPSRPLLILVHRWIALLLAPLLVLVLLTGAALALKPVVVDLGDPARVDLPALVALLDRVDPDGKARQLTLSLDGRIATLRPGPSGGEAAFDVASGAEVDVPFDFFLFAKKGHEGLWLGVNVFVVVAAFALTSLVAIGPFLAKPRRPRTKSSWHTFLGWTLFPLIALGPVTGVLVWLKVLFPATPPVPPADPPLSIARALELASSDADAFLRLDEARAGFAGGNVRLRRQSEVGPRYAIVSFEGVTELSGAPGPVRRLHEGTWGGAFSGLLNLVGVAGLLALLVTGLLSFFSRTRTSRRRAIDVDAEVLVAFASQTGTAARLADATADSLRAAGSRVAVASLAGVEPAELRRMGRVLLLVSTTGEGEVPDQAQPFLRKLEPDILEGVGFSMLALGDRGYGEENFAGGGRQVREALLEAGASELQPLAVADGDPSEAWTAWLDHLSKSTHLKARPVELPQGDVPVELTLTSRRQLNDPRFPETSEVWALEFHSEAPLDFRPGDLLFVSPPGGGPARPYSIGSSPSVDPRRILLTVSLTHVPQPDGSVRFGLASGMLCRRLAEGDRLPASIRRHPAFEPPDDARPMVLVAGGCGIAPFVGFLEERDARLAAGERMGPAWLVFGNRRRKGDYFHGERFEEWRERGVLDRLDTAFSRDPDDGAYVQDRLREQRRELLRWLVHGGGVLYVCGRSSTLGAGVDRALREILMQERLVASEDAAARLLDEWTAAGKIRRDLFD